MSLIKIKYEEIKDEYSKEVEYIMDNFRKLESKDLKPEDLRWEIMYWGSGYKSSSIKACIRASYGLHYKSSKELSEIPGKVLSKVMIEKLIK